MGCGHAAPGNQPGTLNLDIADFDLRALPAGFHDNPYPFYHALREQAPVRRMPDGSWLLTAHADLVAVYRDAAGFSSDKRREFAPKVGPGTPLFRHHTTSLVFNDAPLHTRVRRLIAGALTGRAVAEMEAGVVALVDRLLDGIAARGQFDLIADFAAAIPVEVIGNLLGVPLADRAPLRDWSLAILGALEPALTPAQLAAGQQAVTEFLAYLEVLVAERRRRPGDPAHDMLTRLILGESEDGERLSAEEFLRYESSNQLGNRLCVRDCDIGGVRITAGTPVTLCIGAANRDPAQFPDPDRLDLAREPNRHLAFGLGVHQCAGLAVARLEGRVAITRFLQRFPRYQPAGPAVRGGRARFRGYLSVPMVAG